MMRTDLSPHPAMTRFPWYSAFAMLSASLAFNIHAAPLDAMASANIAANSYANVEQVRTRHIALDLSVDFKKSQISGTAALELERVDPAAKQVVLDTQDLDIRKVETSADGEVWLKGQFTLGKSDEVLGAPLT